MLQISVALISQTSNSPLLQFHQNRQRTCHRQRDTWSVILESKKTIAICFHHVKSHWSVTWWKCGVSNDIESVKNADVFVCRMIWNVQNVTACGLYIICRKANAWYEICKKANERYEICRKANERYQICTKVNELYQIWTKRRCVWNDSSVKKFMFCVWNTKKSIPKVNAIKENNSTMFSCWENSLACHLAKSVGYGII